MDTTGNTKTKDISHYLHLYLGCNVQTTVKGKYVHPYGSVGITVIDADSFENLIRHLKFKESYQKDGYNDYDWVYVKPILRPLSDMTEEEENEMIATQDDVKLEGYPEILLKTDSGETFRWMLSKGFDLFGLIEAGLAIDKTKHHDLK